MPSGRRVHDAGLLDQIRLIRRFGKYAVPSQVIVLPPGVDRRVIDGGTIERRRRTLGADALILPDRYQLAGSERRMVPMSSDAHRLCMSMVNSVKSIHGPHLFG